MSRFDLFFVVIDECDEYEDYTIAQHIVDLHVKKERAFKTNFSPQMLQRYIKFARTIKPEFTKKAAEELRESYARLRRQDTTYENQKNKSYRITVRQLESLIRLSEAMARIYCS